MKSTHAVCAALLLVFVLLAFGSMESEESVEQDSSTAAPAVYVSASKLFADYDANEVSADEKYKDRVLVVSATIKDIGKDIMDTMYVTLETTDDSFGGVQCMFADEHKSHVASAAKGQQVTIRGRCDGKLMNVLLRGCRFE